jgi:NAD(P)-dependent dehydrogenase (short-subunit alcohol dehydrogenase family)
MNDEFKGRIALVTAAAGKGSGQAIARRLAAGAATVVVTDILEYASPPMPTPVRVDDIAEATAFLASDRARHITGEILNVAAGAYMRN